MSWTPLPRSVWTIIAVFVAGMVGFVVGVVV